MDGLFPRVAQPDQATALRVGDVVMDFRTLARRMAAHIEGLERAGIMPGDHVAVWTQRSVDTPVALLANALAGVVSVPLNPSLGTMEIGHILADALPKAVFAAAPKEVRAATPNVIAIPTAESSGPLPARAVDDAPLLILYTSGTTGAPKGAVLSARNVASNLDGLAAAWNLTDADTIVHALPMFHVHGLVLGLFGAARAGAALTWVPRFEPDALGHALEGPSRVLYAVPTLYHRLADAAASNGRLAAALGNARLLVSGSAGLPVRDHTRIREITGRHVIERYGLTETIINCALRHDEVAPGYVGRAVPGVEVRLVSDARIPMDAHDDATLGEIAVRGPNVFRGYLNRDDATARVVDADGFFYTGDLATRTAAGHFRIVGRRETDLIKTGGFKVGAGEIEAALLEHPAVTEAAALGVPDDDLGERIEAHVVLRSGTDAPTQAALADFVADLLSPHKRPRRVHFVGELPRNAMGKVLKSKLRG